MEAQICEILHREDSQKTPFQRCNLHLQTGSGETGSAGAGGVFPIRHSAAGHLLPAPYHLLQMGAVRVTRSHWRVSEFHAEPVTFVLNHSRRCPPIVPETGRPTTNSNLVKRLPKRHTPL